MKITEVELKKIREVYRLSLKEMAPLIGINFTYLSLIENSKRNLTDTVRSKLIVAFDLTDEKLERILRIHEEFTYTGGSAQ
ncbi:helix-turn-helix domain-containing protein [Metabacillus sp. Hm71]|uniref:helix-turn-helix domain-containing protein n=1 Tax=Metabacillus sp. Hm71 TaxID=3450743 RepID=UPI003F436D16